MTYLVVALILWLIGWADSFSRIGSGNRWTRFKALRGRTAGAGRMPSRAFMGGLLLIIWPVYAWYRVQAWWGWRQR